MTRERARKGDVDELAMRQGRAAIGHGACASQRPQMEPGKGTTTTEAWACSGRAETIGSEGWSRRSCSHFCTVLADAAVPGRRCAAPDGMDAAAKLAEGWGRRVAAVHAPPTPATGVGQSEKLLERA